MIRTALALRSAREEAKALALTIGIVLGCGNGDPVGSTPESCTFELESGCWTFLGLEEEWVASIAATPWGVFVGTFDGRLFRYDSDRQWRAVEAPEWRNRLAARALLFVPADPPRLLAGLSFIHDSNDTTSAALYASFDRGRSWVPSDGGLAANARDPWQHRVFVLNLAVDPGDPRRVFMSNIHGVLRSNDAGGTWDFVFGDLDNLSNGFRSVLIDPSRSGRIWTGGQGLVFNPFVMVSSDWGESWEPTIPRCQGAVFETPLYALALAPGMPNRIFAGAATAFYRSDANGADGSWDCVGGPSGEVVRFAEVRGQLYALSVFVEYELEPDGTIREVSAMGLYRTTDNGDRWDALAVPYTAEGPSAAATDQGRGRILIGTRSGVWSFTP
jgi:hypothetical protein